MSAPIVGLLRVLAAPLPPDHAIGNPMRKAADTIESLLEALSLAERNARSRLYQLPLKITATERAPLETELAVYRAAIAKAEGNGQ